MLKIFDIMFDAHNMMPVSARSRQKERAMRLAIVCAVAVLALAAPAAAQHAQPSANLQGNDSAAWMADPHIHQFYDLSKATLGRGTEGVDVAAYEQKAYAIFRDFGASMGM